MVSAKLADVTHQDLIQKEGGTTGPKTSTPTFPWSGGNVGETVLAAEEKRDSVSALVRKSMSLNQVLLRDCPREEC